MISAWFFQIKIHQNKSCSILLKHPQPDSLFLTLSEITENTLHSQPPLFFPNRYDTPNKWEWHEASAVTLNSICDAPWTRWQCSLFCCLSLFITPSSLDSIQKPIPAGNLCASLPRDFNRAEVSLQHQAEALPGNEQHPGSCIKSCTTEKRLI